jgi:hypothetical protein
VFAYSVASGPDADGFGIVTDRFLCLLGPEATLEVASEAFRMLDADDADAAVVLQLLTSQHGLVRFAVVELLDPASRNFAIAVRGKISLELEQASATRLSGASDEAWISTEARGVNSLHLMLDADVPSGTLQLPIRRGVVVTSYLSLDDPAAAPAAPRPQKASRSAAPKKPRSTTGPAATPAVEADHEDTIIGPKADLDSAWVLTLPDGSEVSVGLPIVVGRRPWAVEPTDREVVHVVAPASKNEISGTHLELFLSEGTVHARDLNSTNGTVVRTKSRPPRLLHSGGTTELVAGDILEVGEDFSIALGGRD